jgi:hypothetical protein
VKHTSFEVLICPEDRTQMALGKEILLDRLPADVWDRVASRQDYWLVDEALGVSSRSAGQAPAGCPLPQALDLVARRDSHRDHDLRGLNERDIQERRQPAATLDLGPGPVGVIRPGLLCVEPAVPRVDRPDLVLLVAVGQVRGRQVTVWLTVPLLARLRRPPAIAVNPSGGRELSQ